MAIAQNRTTETDTEKNSPNKNGRGLSNFQNSQDSLNNPMNLGSSGEGTNQLEEFITYMKGNWKIILSELVAAGVTAYITHSKKDREGKDKTAHN